MAPGIGGAFGKAAPAAADFQNALAPRQPRQDAVILAGLRGFQIVRPVEQRRGIAHPRVEPEVIEFVADIVMGADIARGPRKGIGAQPVDQAQAKRRQHPLPPLTAQMIQIADGKGQQRLKIGAVPMACDMGLAKAHIAAPRQRGKQRPVGDLHLGLGAGAAEMMAMPLGC